MTRERADNYSEKRQNILSRAAELFAQDGFQISTLKQVANVCGVSKSYIYHYFETKEDILFTICNDHAQSLSDALSEITSRSSDAEDQFREFIKRFIEIAANSRDEQMVLSNDLKFLPDDKRKVISKLESEIVDQLAELFKRLNPTLVKHKSLQHPSALLLFGMIIWTFTWYKKSGSLSPHQLGEFIANLFLNGLIRISLD